MKYQRSRGVSGKNNTAQYKLSLCTYYIINKGKKILLEQPTSAKVHTSGRYAVEISNNRSESIYQAKHTAKHTANHISPGFIRPGS